MDTLLMLLFCQKIRIDLKEAGKINIEMSWLLLIMCCFSDHEPLFVPPRD